jgi:hypothetical protein
MIPESESESESDTSSVSFSWASLDVLAVGAGVDVDVGVDCRHPALFSADLLETYSSFESFSTYQLTCLWHK